jgi:3-oxoacyl-[acyl-carrier protein] reductase
MKRILITGGNKGIGLETTKILSQKGYQIIVVARQNINLEGIKNCEFIEYDLRNIADISALVEKIGEIDVLINNSGIMNTCPYNNYSQQEKEDLMKVNLDAPIELITCVSKQMIMRKEGRIVNIASVAGQIGHPDVWYAVSKAGLINATKSFAKLLGTHGIVINAVAPGPVETDMLGTIPEARKKAVLASIYSGRFATAQEVAKTIVWLATESPEYINGTCIDINNGSFPR